MTLAGRLLQTSLTHFKLNICLSQPQKILQANKTFEACEVKKKLSNLQNLINQVRAERSVFGQHDLLSIGHNVGLELTLPFFL